MENVLVMMSTYNGEHYIREQLESIRAQIGVRVFLLIRDDGSSDNTLGILMDYASFNKDISIIEGTNCGAIKSFYQLMEYAVIHFPDYNYYAFSDQDDFWYPDKLSRAISMNQRKRDLYFYHSCYDVVDADLNLLYRTTTSNSYGTLGDALIANPSIGCSEVFTFRVLEHASKIASYKMEKESYYPYHDLWVYLVSLIVKADVIFDDFSALKYRQHGHNVIGTRKSRIKTFKLQLHNLLSNKGIKSSFAKMLLDLYSVDDDIRETLEKAAFYKKSFLSRLALIFNPDFKTRNSHRNVAFKLSVLLGLY